MSKHSNLDPFMRPGYPELIANEGSIGNIFVYRADSATSLTNFPVIGDIWADGRAVAGYHLIGLANSDYAELTVTTATNTTGAVSTSVVEKTIYSLRWRPVQKPLEVHPAFTGGAYALDATARKCILGWRAEHDPDLRSQFKFKMLDSSGTPGTLVDISTASANALVFLKFVVSGVEEYVDYLPIWRKRSIYRGSTTPPTSAIGAKGTPAGTPPSTYEWVKSADDVESVGSSSRWRRDEEWEGCIRVYASADAVFPLP